MLDGRPYGAFAAGLRRLDRPTNGPVLHGDAWPKTTFDALGDRVSAVDGRWPDRLVAVLPRRKGDYAGADALFFDGKTWTVLPDPTGIVQYVQLFAAGRERVVALGTGSAGTRLVELRGPGPTPPAAGGTPVAGCGGRAVVVWIAVSPGGRVAALRSDCSDVSRRKPVFVAVERFDERLRSLGLTAFPGSTGIGSRAAMAWLDEEALVLGLSPQDGGKHRLVKVSRGETTDLPLPADDGVVSFTRAANGEHLVATRKHWFALDTSGGVRGAVTPWPKEVIAAGGGDHAVTKLVEGDDGALYLQLVSPQAARVLRCDRERRGP